MLIYFWDKLLSVRQINWLKNHLPFHNVDCVWEYIFFVSKKTHTNKHKTRETKEERKTKKTTKKMKKKMLLWAVSVENLTGYGNIVCEFALCNFNWSHQIICYFFVWFRSHCKNTGPVTRDHVLSKNLCNSKSFSLMLEQVSHF